MCRVNEKTDAWRHPFRLRVASIRINYFGIGSTMSAFSAKVAWPTLPLIRY